MLRSLIPILPPLEVAATLGLILFTLSWAIPRRLVTLPSSGRRRTALTWIGVGGSLLVAAVATFASAMPFLAGRYDWGVTSGAWTRPAPLLAVIAVLIVASLLLRREPLPTPEERSIAPRRSWRAFAPAAPLWIATIIAAVIGLTSLWQTAIGTTAPATGPFLGIVPEYSDLPVYMPFNSGYGYVAGAGWPNTLATLVLLACAVVAFVLVLRGDANRPISARSTAATTRIERELTARLLSWIVLGGLLATLGAVWMHTGSIGQGSVGFEEQWVSDDVSNPQVFVGSGYDAIARPMNLIGYALQALGFALLLRISVDTVRAALEFRQSRTHPSSDDDALSAAGSKR